MRTNPARTPREINTNKVVSGHFVSAEIAEKIKQHDKMMIANKVSLPTTLWSVLLRSIADEAFLLWELLNPPEFPCPPPMLDRRPEVDGLPVLRFRPDDE